MTEQHAKSLVGRVGYVVAGGEIAAYTILDAQRLGPWWRKRWMVSMRCELSTDDCWYESLDGVLQWDFETAVKIAESHILPPLEYYQKMRDAIKVRGPHPGQFDKNSRLLHKPAVLTLCAHSDALDPQCQGCGVNEHSPTCGYLREANDKIRLR